MLPVNRRNQNWLPSLFNDLFDDNYFNQSFFTNRDVATPAMNITETDNEFEIEFATPGMTKEDFSVSLENDNELVISLEKKQDPQGENDEQKKNRKYHRHEFSYQSFRQSFTLAENIDLDKISAKMENGILTITLPKKEVTKNIPISRQIDIC